MAMFAKFSWALAVAADADYQQLLRPRHRPEDTEVSFTPDRDTAGPEITVATAGTIITLPVTTVSLILVQNMDASNYVTVRLTIGGATKDHRVLAGGVYFLYKPGGVTAMSLIADTAAVRCRVVVLGTE